MYDYYSLYFQNIHSLTLYAFYASARFSASMFFLEFSFFWVYCVEKRERKTFSNSNNKYLVTSPRLGDINNNLK